MKTQDSSTQQSKWLTRSLIIFVCLFVALGKFDTALAQKQTPMVRIARLRIDSAQLEKYKTALKEHAETAVSVEPGVLTLYAVYEKNNPTHVTVFEIYASQEAYNAHIHTAHFLKYKTSTKDMVLSLELVETVPIALESKPRLN